MSEIQSLAAAVAISLLLAFAVSWFAKSEGAAYTNGLAIGFLVLFGRSCVEMSSRDPVKANEAATGFFWALPLVIGWLVLGVIAVAVARELRRMRAAKGKNEP